MTNREKFKSIFGVYAEEFWAYPKDKMLDWLQYDVPDTNVGDMISRQEAINTLNVGAELLRRVLDDTNIVGAERAKYEWGLGLIESYISDMKELPPAQQNRIARETAGKSPEEIYDFLHWLLIDYGRQFTDSRLAVIEWLKEERRE